MKALDMNTVVVVSVGHLRPDSNDPKGYSLAPDGLLYPSSFVEASERPTTDLLEMILSLADQRGMKVYVGSLQTATDWSDGTEFNALRKHNKDVAAEIVQRYGWHTSLVGWYFTQEIWMNWVKYYGALNGNTAAGYYGTVQMANWIADMKAIDPGKLTTAAIVIKKDGTGAMPGLTPAELQTWTASFLQTAHLDILMPQDGIGAGAGAPGIDDLGNYFSAMKHAAGTTTALWSTIETFTADPNLSSERFPPAPISRIQSQVNAVAPYVSGYVSWIFGNDMSPQATYYPVQASELNRQYQFTFKPQVIPAYDTLPIASYWFSATPIASYADTTPLPSKLSDRTGGGYNGSDLSSWVGFANENYGSGTVQITADLGAPKQIHLIRALTQSWTGFGSYRPSQIEVEVSQDNWTWTPFGSTYALPSDTPNFAVMWGEVQGSASAQYVRWTFTYWQSLFLAELEVIGD